MFTSTLGRGRFFAYSAALVLAEVLAVVLCIMGTTGFKGLAESGSLADLIVWLPIQNILWVAVLVYAIAWFVMERTAFGKRVYAVGANRTVAVLSGQPALTPIT